MTDEARLARLTELARWVWPYCSEVEVASGPKGLLVAGNDPHVAPGAPRTAQLYINHHDSPVPLLDALEAALLVLVGDSDFYKRNYEWAEEECTAEREMARQLEAKLAKVRAWALEVPATEKQRAALDAILDEEAP